MSNFLTKKGRYSMGIIDSDGEKIRCHTYRMVKEQIEGRSGYFALQKHYDNWILFQYVLIDES